MPLQVKQEIEKVIKNSCIHLRKYRRKDLERLTASLQNHFGIWVPPKIVPVDSSGFFSKRFRGVNEQGIAAHVERIFFKVPEVVGGSFFGETEFDIFDFGWGMDNLQETYKMDLPESVWESIETIEEAQSICDPGKYRLTPGNVEQIAKYIIENHPKIKFYT